MFIEYKDINKFTDVTIDVRTNSEYNNMKLFEYNVPIINEKDYNKLKKHKYLAIPIILKGFIKDKKKIREELLDLTRYGNYRLILGCSQGRVRSPIMYFYARYLGIDAKVLKRGIKPFFKETNYNIKNLYGFLDI